MITEKLIQIDVSASPVPCRYLNMGNWDAYAP